jgi:hypothetical protein
VHRFGHGYLQPGFSWIDCKTLAGSSFAQIAVNRRHLEINGEYAQLDPRRRGFVILDVAGEDDE